MFLVPVGIYYGAPFGIGYYIWKSMIPACLGNIIGGVGFTGVSYWYVNLSNRARLRGTDLGQVYVDAWGGTFFSRF